MLEERRQQPAENHGVGDVGNVKLVETDEAPLARDPRRDRGERIRLLLQPGQILVDVAHERVEMDARLAPHAHRREKPVHQEALAAPDPAPQIDAARDVGRREQLRQRRLPRGAEAPRARSRAPAGGRAPPLARNRASCRGRPGSERATPPACRRSARGSWPGTASFIASGDRSRAQRRVLRD